jgi:hypothetical protein
MSLSDKIPSTGNIQAVIAVAGALTAAALPWIEEWCGKAPLIQIQLAQIFSYILNVVATSLPGRIDSYIATKQNNPLDHIKEKTLGKSDDEKVADHYLADRRGQSMFAPAGVTFAIWGPIFIGELIYVYKVYQMSSSDSNVDLVRKVAGSFICSQIFQALWCASFRPSAKKEEGPWMLLSSFMLSGIALMLNRAHSLFSPHSSQFWQYVYLWGPMTLHFGWTTAAALVNWNGDLSLLKSMDAQKLAALGHTSVVLATSIGVGITLQRQAPVLGATFAWALAGCAFGMQARVWDVKVQGEMQKEGTVGAQTQKWLCLAGAIASAAASYVAYTQRNA